MIDRETPPQGTIVGTWRKQIDESAITDFANCGGTLVFGKQ